MVGTFACTNFSRKLGESVNSLSFNILHRARLPENRFFNLKSLSVTRPIIRLLASGESKRSYNFEVGQLFSMSKLFQKLFFKTIFNTSHRSGLSLSISQRFGSVLNDPNNCIVFTYASLWRNKSRSRAERFLGKTHI